MLAPVHLKWTTPKQLHFPVFIFRFRSMPITVYNFIWQMKWIKKKNNLQIFCSLTTQNEIEQNGFRFFLQFYKMANQKSVWVIISHQNYIPVWILIRSNTVIRVRFLISPDLSAQVREWNKKETKTSLVAVRNVLLIMSSSHWWSAPIENKLQLPMYNSQIFWMQN